MSLKYHPDKVTDDEMKETNKIKFQCLGKIYSVLSDEEKKKLYDESGIIDGEDTLFSSTGKDWDAYFRNLFKKITKEDINSYFEKYRDSNEERVDLLRIYEKCQGDMDLILEEMISEDLMDNEPRFRKILLEAIENKEVPTYELFVNENKKKASKRKAHYAKEAKEAEVLKKEMGIDESQDSLRNAILSRRKDQSNNFLDNLTKKYEKIEKDKTKTFSGKKKSLKKKTTARSESEVENESENSESEAESLDEDDEDEEDTPPPPKKSSLNRKKSMPSSKAKPSAIKKKVKRL